MVDRPCGRLGRRGSGRPARRHALGHRRHGVGSMSASPSRAALTALHARGAHMVLCCTKKGSDPKGGFEKGYQLPEKRSGARPSVCPQGAYRRVAGKPGLRRVRR